MKAKDQYGVLAPVTKTGKHIILSRRIGTKELFSPIAEVRSESIANQIVEGLHLRQGEATKVETSAQTTLAALRADLQSVRAVCDGLKTENSRLKSDARVDAQKISELTNQRNRAQQELDIARRDISTLSQKVDQARIAGATV